MEEVQSKIFHTHRHAKPAPRPYVLAATEIIRSARFRKIFLFCNSRGSHGGGAALRVRSDSSSELTITAFDVAQENCMDRAGISFEASFRQKNPLLSK